MVPPLSQLRLCIVLDLSEQQTEMKASTLFPARDRPLVAVGMRSACGRGSRNKHTNRDQAQGQDSGLVADGRRVSPAVQHRTAAGTATESAQG
jgi:hypothetical protein